MDESEEYEVMSCVCGYHIYQLIWDASIGEMLRCKSDSHNSHDRYAISIMKDEITVGHLPRELSRMCSLSEVSWYISISLNIQRYKILCVKCSFLATRKLFLTVKFCRFTVY